MSDDHELCITFDMDDIRSCTIRDQHRITCDGWRYRWLEREVRWELVGECNGCLPKEARFGYLCGACYRRAELALTEWTVDRAAALASIDRAVAHDNGGIRSASAGHIPIPATRLAVDEIERLLKRYPGRLDHWVSTPAGAKAAVRFARAVPTALRTHQLEERTHQVTHVRCPECSNINLIWTPPGAARAAVKIVCRTCAHAFTQDELEAEYEWQQNRNPAPVMDAGAPVTLDRNQAEPFDPTSVEHEGFDRLSTHPMKDLRAIAEDLEVPRFKQLRKSELIRAIRAAQAPEPEEAA